jgi:hypothetical protein
VVLVAVFSLFAGNPSATSRRIAAAADRLSDSRWPRYDGRMADFNRMAHRIVQEATEPAEREEPSTAQTNGRNGGLKGGKARAEKLSPEKRSEIARKAAAVRWNKG